MANCVEVNERLHKQEMMRGNTIITNIIFDRDTDMEKWTTPRDYSGNDYTGYYILYSRGRDSDPLERANFESIVEMFEDIGVTIDTSCDDIADKYCNYDVDGCAQGLSDSECSYNCTIIPEVVITRASHWAWGWVEQILVRCNCSDKVRDNVVGIYKSLDEYPILDDDKYYEYEQEEYGYATGNINVYYSREDIAANVDVEPAFHFERGNAHFDESDGDYDDEQGFQCLVMDSKGEVHTVLLTIQKLYEIYQHEDYDIRNVEGDHTLLYDRPDFEDDLTMIISKEELNKMLCDIEGYNEEE